MKEFLLQRNFPTPKNALNAFVNKNNLGLIFAFLLYIKPFGFTVMCNVLLHELI